MTTVLGTRDILWSAPYSDQDRSRYGEQPSAQEFELRVAATPAGGGALIDRITSVSQIVEQFRTGRQLHALTTTTGWSADSNVAVATYSATNPTGYAAADSLEVQATGASSTDRGARYTFATPLDLSVYPGGFLLYLHRRCTSVTNLTRWVLRFEFATTSDWAQYELIASGGTINTWAEVVVAKGNPQSTNGTVDWSNVTAIRLFADVSAGYTGNLEVRDLRIGTVQTAKSTPDDGFAWETSVDARVRYRDDADAVTSSTLAASSIAGATNVKYTGGSYNVGDQLTVETAGLVETRTISTVGTSGAGGTGITVSEAFTFAHGSGDTIKVYPWGSWTSWVTVKASEPPIVAASSPSDGATVTDPTVPLVHTYSSPASKAQASHTSRVYRLAGMAALLEASAPVSWWRLSEPSGTFADEVGGISGTASGTMSRGVTGLLSPADTDGAVDLDGSTGSIAFGDVYDFEATAAFTLCALVQPDTLTSLARVIAKDGSTGWRLWVDSDGTVAAQRFDAGGSDTVSGPAVIGTSSPSLLTLTYDGTTLILYVNGVAGTGVASSRSLPGNGSEFTIGRQPGGSSWFNGKVDEVAVWDRALSASEVAALQNARTSAYDVQLLREHTTEDAAVSETLPAFLLDTGNVYAWEVEASDTEGLTGATDRRYFLTDFTEPDPVENLAGSPDADSSGIALTWDPSADPNLHHYRVYWQDGRGEWIRVDGGPAELDDGRTPLTDPAFTHHGGRLGDNHYQVTAHNGAQESDGATVVVTLDAPTGGSWMFVRPDVERYTFPLRVAGAPRVHEAAIERFQPPGRGSTVHLKWGATGKRVSVTVRRRPSTEGDLSDRLGELQAGDLPGWLKAPEGWAWDPMWCQVVGAIDTPGIGGLLDMQIDLETTEA